MFQINNQKIKQPFYKPYELYELRRGKQKEIKTLPLFLPPCYD